MVTAIKESLAKTFLSDAAPGGTIKISHIRSAIASTGVDDYVITAIYKELDPIPIDDIALNYPYTARYGFSVFADL